MNRGQYCRIIKLDVDTVSLRLSGANNNAKKDLAVRPWIKMIDKDKDFDS